MSIFTRDWAAGATERALKTGLQTVVAALATNATILTLDWQATGTLVASAMLASIATSMSAATTVTAPGAPTADAVVDQLQNTMPIPIQINRGIDGMQAEVRRRLNWPAP